MKEKWLGVTVSVSIVHGTAGSGHWKYLCKLWIVDQL